MKYRIKIKKQKDAYGQLLWDWRLWLAIILFSIGYITIATDWVDDANIIALILRLIVTLIPPILVFGLLGIEIIKEND